MDEVMRFLRQAVGLAGLLAQGLNGFVGRLAENLQLGWDASQVGMCSGAVLLGIVGFVIFRIRIWWQGFWKFFKKQSVKHETDRTPSEVGVSSCTSLLALIVFVLFLVLVVVLYGGISPQ